MGPYTSRDLRLPIWPNNLFGSQPLRFTISVNSCVPYPRSPWYFLCLGSQTMFHLPQLLGARSEHGFQLRCLGPTRMKYSSLSNRSKVAQLRGSYFQILWRLEIPVNPLDSTLCDPGQALRTAQLTPSGLRNMELQLGLSFSKRCRDSIQIMYFRMLSSHKFGCLTWVYRKSDFKDGQARASQVADGDAVIDHFYALVLHGAVEKLDMGSNTLKQCKAIDKMIVAIHPCPSSPHKLPHTHHLQNLDKTPYNPPPWTLKTRNDPTQTRRN